MDEYTFPNGNKIEIIQGDITTLHVDAIANAANCSLLGGGGVDGAIHRAAGPQLLEACIPLHGCRTGEAKITPGFRLPAKFVVHTPGPVWHGGNSNERQLLSGCYLNSMRLADGNGCETLAFPSISTGVYGYPVDEAARTAVAAIAAFIGGAEKKPAHLHTVVMCCFDSRTKSAYETALEEKFS
ncbi:MAG TPA: O-acetyl-ADP-ribose deacetylase [Treponema sp.]|nr:O-acetyl-ADP-ribose deacetylase [Treponema sp.]